MIIATDTASDILSSEAEAMDVAIVPLEIGFGDTVFRHNTPESLDLFYRMLEERDDFPTTSQPNPGVFLELIDKARQASEDLVIITISSGLSGTFSCACMAAEMSGYADHVHVVDSRAAIMPERILVETAVRMRDEGCSAAEIEKALCSLRERTKVFGMPQSLTYLKRGGRIPPAMAAVGNLLSIKPIIAVKDGILESVAKARGLKGAKAELWKRLDGADIDPSSPLFMGYSENPTLVEAFRDETIERFGWRDRQVRMYRISGAVGAHLGPGCIAVGYVEAKRN